MTAPADPPDRSAVHAVGWLTLAALAYAGVAWLAQAEVAPSATYAVLHPLRIVQTVVSNPTGPTWLAVGLLFGLAARDDGLLGTLRAAYGRTSRTRRLGILGVSCLVPAVDFVVNPYHRGPDLVAVGMLTAALLAATVERPSRGRLASGLELLFCALVFVAASYGFTVFKAALFQMQNPKDGALVAMETALFGEPLHRSAARLAAARPTLALVADAVYDRMFHHMLIVSVFLTALGRAAVRRTYLTAICLAYLAGGVLYHVLPALGPAYAEPESYAFLRRLPIRTNVFQSMLQRTTAQAAAGELRVLHPYAYIAAMPSLHMAHETILLFYARASRPFFALSLLFYGVTAFAVLALGWHYALDVVAGIALGAASIALAERYGATAFPAAAAAPGPTPTGGPQPADGATPGDACEPPARA